MSVQRLWREYTRHRAALISLIFLIAVVISTFIAPFIAPYNPNTLTRDVFLKPSWTHLMGTDNLGRDIFSRIIYGARVSLLVGVVAGLIAISIGTLIGSISGYFGGKIDDLLMRFTDAFMVVPTFFLIILIVFMFGSTIWNIMIVIGITTWSATARVARAEFLSLREREFIEAARLSGCGDFRIIYRQILPNALPPIIAMTTLRIGGAILNEAALSFLGLGDISKITWGLMLHFSLKYFRKAWWMTLFPGLSIFFVVLSLNLIGDGLNAALNPQLRHR